MLKPKIKEALEWRKKKRCNYYVCDDNKLIEELSREIKRKAWEKLKKKLKNDEKWGDG